MVSKLSLYLVTPPGFQPGKIEAQLTGDRYQIKLLDYGQKFLAFLEANKEQIDCLVVVRGKENQDYFERLTQSGILLPCVFLGPTTACEISQEDVSEQLYHSAEKYLDFANLENLSLTIDQAIAQFLHLAPSCALSDKPQDPHHSDPDKTHQAFLLLQQRRLAEKLRERLGYLGVYYKRNPKYFYRSLSPEEQQEFREQFVADYRDIVLSYFSGDLPTNQAIDQFVNQAFFADVSVSYILETHMKLMDEFAQQLKLEGRSEEILLDYRLTLIDIVAHLCEMYRRSIPREDLPFELLFRID
ncbi:circadian clock protein KaiA [Picosynechococcus sp. PCC 7117]|uniref:circadian clock protein KaiA n=1 Tax=Picosynechococcus sp. PCC 7117 TaxID=195498 RepID=UPI000810B6C3|nr:circadian clock protein KaiA [Picosynechococcus sp. PCC 7117]ANV86257.1 circadian clock protein KaiA [Picosynechococcus sp. PCC 7117]